MKKFIQSFLFLFVLCVTPKLFAWDVNATYDATDVTPGDGTCADSSGYCTLRAAIQEANAAGGLQTITIPAGTYSLTDTTTGDDTTAYGDLDILTSITITGAGSGSTMIDASSSNDRIFHVFGAGLSLVVEGVTITGGGSSSFNDGGAIHASNFADLTIQDVIFTLNEVEDNGGAIYLENAVAQITSSTFTFNEADNGGAIYQERGTLTVSESVFNQNSAEAGGAFSIIQALEFNMSYSEVTGNIGGIGGGFILYFNTSGIEISYSTISSNLSAMGGAIASAYTTPVKISHSTLSNNSVIKDSAGSSESRCTDGIDNDGDGDTDFYDSNCWEGVGGAIADVGQISGGSVVGGSNDYQLINTTISGNSAASFGGAVFLATASTLKTYNVTIAENSAVQGGGIYNLSIFDPSNVTSTVELYNTILANNSASRTGDDCVGEVTSGGYSLIGDQLDCDFISATGDQVGDSSGPGAIDPLLGAMTNNGGETDTHALTTGSTAIDGGNPAGCLDESGTILLIDQRDELRPTDGNGDTVDQCDIGAYEAVAIDPVETPEDPEEPAEEPKEDEEEPADDEDDEDCGCSSCCGCSGDITVTANASVGDITVIGGDTIITISYTGTTTDGDIDIDPIPDEGGEEEEEAGILALEDQPWGADLKGSSGGCTLNAQAGMNVAQGLQLLFWTLFMGIPVYLKKKNIFKK